MSLLPLVMRAEMVEVARNHRDNPEEIMRILLQANLEPRRMEFDGPVQGWANGETSYLARSFDNVFPFFRCNVMAGGEVRVRQSPGKYLVLCNYWNEAEERHVLIIVKVAESR